MPAGRSAACPAWMVWLAPASGSGHVAAAPRALLGGTAAGRPWGGPAVRLAAPTQWRVWLAPALPQWPRHRHRAPREAARTETYDAAQEAAQNATAAATFYAAALAAAAIPTLVFAAKALCKGMTMPVPGAAAQWAVLAGECGPAVASLLLLRGAARSGGLRAQTPKRLHVSVVLGFLIAGGVLAGSASCSARAVPAAMLGTLAAALAALGAAGALIYLPFDLPTALSLWLVPRPPRRGLQPTFSAAVSTGLTALMPCVFVYAAASLAAFIMELANGASTALGALRTY